MHCFNNLLIDKTNNCQQYLLQIIFFAKKFEIDFIKGGKNYAIIKQVVQANLKDNYCLKLCNK